MRIAHSRGACDAMERTVRLNKIAGRYTTPQCLVKQSRGPLKLCKEEVSAMSVSSHCRYARRDCAPFESHNRIEIPTSDKRNGLSNTRSLWFLGFGTMFALATPAPAAAAAAEAALSHYSHLYHMVDDKTMYLGCLALGCTFSVLTIATTGRFIMSFFPTVEKAARRARGPLALRAFVILDALLDPAQERLFNMKGEGDVNYAAMFYLAIMSAVLEALFGDVGLLAHSVPDSGMLYMMHYLIFFQQALLLPQWAMAVFRWFSII